MTDEIRSCVADKSLLGAPSSSWTIDTLRLHLTALIEEISRRHEQRFESHEKAITAALASSQLLMANQEKAVAAALAAADKAVNKAEVASEKRFEGVNEFRAALTDQAARLISRSEVEQRFTSSDEKLASAMATVTDRLTHVENVQASSAGAKGDRETTAARAMWAVGIGLSAIIAIVSIIISIVKR